MAIVAGKKVGKSTLRNKIRRRIRETVLPFRDRMKKGVDLIVVAKPASVEMGFAALKQEFLKLARKGSLINDEAIGAVDD